MKKKLEMVIPWNNSPGMKQLLLRMKLTLTVLFIAVLQTFAEQTYSQTTTLSVNLKNVSVLTALQEIEEQTDFFFLYSRSLIDVERQVDVKLKNVKIFEILDALFSETDVDYKVEEKQIILSKKPVESQKAVEQQKTVSGKVTDKRGNPLPGVTVVVKGTMLGTVSDGDGNYSLSNVPLDATLVFSFVGMKTQETPVKGKSGIGVIMEEETIGVDEVVVIGYGVSNRKDLTGSISSLKVEGAPQSVFPNQNALDVLRGEVPGVDIGVVTTAGGEPSMNIRGQNSINGSNSPLIVLDGMIYSGNINDINPNDIASYDILKDAVSCAVYGSRSANGIIAITTKKGKLGKPIITLNASTGFKRFEKPDLMKTADYLKTLNAKLNLEENSTAFLTQPELDNLAKGIETNWLDLVTRTGFSQNYQVAFSGAAQNANYYISSSYDNVKGVVLGDDYDRISVLGKLNMDITNWLNFSGDGNYSIRDYSGFSASYATALVLPPTTSPYRDDLGNLEKYPRTNSYVNPLWGVDDGTSENKSITNHFLLRSSVLIKVPWIRGLSYRISLQNTLQNGEALGFRHEDYYVKEGEGISRYEPSEIQNLLTVAAGSIKNEKTSSYVIDNILNYNQTFKKYHRFDATLVATRDKSRYYSVITSGKDYAANGNTSLGYWGIHKAAIITNSINTSISANIGYLGRLNYAYGDKYYMSGSYRRDGASVFGENKKWGNFSAFGLGWRISEEKFFTKSEIIDDLKLRLSWGQNGNQGISPYSTLSTVLNGLSAQRMYEFSDEPGVLNYGLYQNALGNSSLGWETTESFNTGFESIWLNNRVFWDLDIYSSKTTDQLFNRNIPIMTGFSTMKASMGQVNNKGIETTIKTINIKKNNLEWQTSLSLWKNFNKLVHLYEEDLNGDGKEDDDITGRLFIGHSLGAIYGYVQDGIVQSDDAEYIALTGSSPGHPKFVDIDDTPGISTSDRKILGYTKPNFKIGFSNTFAYKGLILYALISGTFGNNNYFMQKNNAAFIIATPSRNSDNGVLLPYWTPENPSNIYPSAAYSPDTRYSGLQCRSYIKLQRVSLTYDLGKQMINRIGINSLKVFVTGENLFTITNWSGGDPEAGLGMLSTENPVTSDFSMGINLSF